MGVIQCLSELRATSRSDTLYGINDGEQLRFIELNLWLRGCLAAEQINFEKKIRWLDG